MSHDRRPAVFLSTLSLVACLACPLAAQQSDETPSAGADAAASGEVQYFGALAVQPGVQAPLPANMLGNYYTHPAGGLVQAAMYPSPHPVPYNVGGVYYTYPPLAPHEHLYTHSRVYYNVYAGPEVFYSDPSTRRYPGGYGINKTTVVWHSGSNHMGPLPSSLQPLARFNHAIATRFNCQRGAGIGAGGVIGGAGWAGPAGSCGR